MASVRQGRSARPEPLHGSGRDGLRAVRGPRHGGVVGAFLASGGVMREKNASELDIYRESWVDYRLGPDAESQAKLAAAKQSMPSVNFVGRLLGLREAKKEPTTTPSTIEPAASSSRPGKSTGA